MVLPVGLNITGAQPSSSAGNYIISSSNANAMDAVRRIHNIHTIQVQAYCPYVDFVIMNAEQRYMVRCNRKAVLEKSEELSKIIQLNASIGTASNRRAIDYNYFEISNVDAEDFEDLTRFLETEFIRFKDINHTIRILQLADRFSCKTLYMFCITELDLLISSDTVLDIYTAMSHYRNMLNEDQQLTGERKSKKHKFKKNGPQRLTLEDFGVSLLNNAIEYIDMHAEFILTDPRINNLTFEEFFMILKRNTLQISSEIVVYNCLAYWSLAECMRRDIPPSPSNRRRLLGPLCYAPRYLLMTIAEFNTSSSTVEFLDPTETQLIRTTLQGQKVKNLDQDQLDLLERFRTPRPKFAHMPIHLSDRSNPRNYPRLMRRAETHEDSCLSNCGLNCLSAIICIFD